MRPLSDSLKMGQVAQKLQLVEFPQAEMLGRNCTADTNLGGGTIALKARPDANSATIRDVQRDEIFPWLKEVSAETIDYNLSNQRWVETPEGYIHSILLQPCRNLPNTPQTTLPEGQTGFWAEVTVPYVDLILDNPTPVSGWMRDHAYFGLQPRLHYSQIMWADQIRTADSGEIQYHVKDRYGDAGDLFWADAAAFRPLTSEDISPINGDVDPAIKKVVVNLQYQTLSCREGEREVYFCRVSTGVQEGSTPVGDLAVWRKAVSIRMAANTVATSYDLPGIAWTTLFSGQGVAVHAATSHNDFGTIRSHGCVNCKPEDAKWVFRWSVPNVPLEPGLVDWSGSVGSTHVIVENSF